MKRSFAVLALAVLSCAIATAAEKSGTFTTGDGVKLHYLEAGHGPAILFIPGWTMPAEIWRPQIEYFAQHYRVIAVDPRSQGESDKAPKGNYAERRALDYKELVDGLKLSPVVLVGWSLGVTEILSYLQQFGGQTVRGVVLVDGRIGPVPEFDKVFPAWMHQVQVDREKFASGFIPSMFKKPQTDAYFKKLAADSMKTPNDTAVALIYDMMAREFWSFVGNIDRPIYYAITPSMKAQGDRLRTTLPAAKLELFEDAGHALFVDDADRFNKSVDEFIQAIPAQ